MELTYPAPRYEASTYYGIPPLCQRHVVERFHRQLKSVLKAHFCQEHWTDALPLVLLGVCTSLKQDVGCTAAELVYGTILHLPGGFLSPQDTDDGSDPSSYIMGLRSKMQALRATSPRHSTQPSTPVSNTLKDTAYVFIRHDVVLKLLQPPYDGPYKVSVGLTNSLLLTSKVDRTLCPLIA